jgi:hypothetical protein
MNTSPDNIMPEISNNVLLDSLSENLIKQLIVKYAEKRYIDDNPDSDIKTISDEILKKYLREDDVINFRKANLEKNNKLFDGYGLPNYKYEDLLNDGQNVENDDNVCQEIYDKILEERADKKSYLPFYEKLIETHKKREMKYIGDCVIPNEEEMNEMMQKIEKLMKQFQQMQDDEKKNDKKDNNKDNNKKAKNDNFSKSIKRLNENKDQRIARMKEKLIKKQSNKL